MNPLVFVSALFLAAAPAWGQAVGDTVQAKAKLTDTWKAYPVRTLSSLPETVTSHVDSGLSQYGGLLAWKVQATGFFYATNVNDRWWLVDPTGCLFLDKGVSDVAMCHGASSKDNLKQKFGDEAGWATQTSTFLRSEGFNNLGAWSDVEHLRESAAPLVYTRILNLMSSYGTKRGGTYQQPGHTGYPNDCIFAFDPEFAAYCDTMAQRLTAGKDDPWLLGYFSDNEMPLRHEALKNYLKLPPTDPGHQAALRWLQTRHGAKATTAEITVQDEKDFLAVVVAQYYRVVSSAIKKYDPNHLYLGTRFNGRVLNQLEVFQAAGPYVDVVSVNYYWAWTPDQAQIAGWAHAAGKPILITEWYAKALDSGMGNTGGAGWIVQSQHDRGRFYQNFTLGLLQSKACVGWDWFKYADNDPENTKADPSNRDSNKGIVNIHYEPYQPLLEAMKPLNDRAYALAAYFSKSAARLPHADSASRDPAPVNAN